MSLGSAPTSTIDIDYTRAQGVGSTGQIYFEPKRMVIGSTVLSNFAVKVEIVDGVGSVDLVRLPFGTYHVRELIDGRTPHEFSFALPLDAPAVIQYESITSVTPVIGTYTSIRTINNVAPDPVTGNLELAVGGVVPDASAGTKGILRLTGDLGGTASSPELSAGRIAEINGKYVKPGPGIPSTDMTTAVQTTLGQAVSAVQPAALAAVVDLIPTSPGDINAQPVDTDLTTIAGLSPADGSLMARVAGAWGSQTLAQVKTSLTLVKADVGLSDVNNTSDAAKPISTATQTALDLKAALTVTDALDGRIDVLEAGGGGGDLELYPPTAAGFKEWTADPQVCSADFNHGNGTLLMMRFRWRQASENLSEIGFAVTSSASGPGAYSGVALYEDGTGVVNKIGESPNAGSQWTSTGVKSVALTAGAAVVKGSYYYAAVLWNGSGAGKIAGVPLVILDALMNAGVRRSVYLGGQSTFPSTINIGTANTNNATYWLSAK